MQPFHYRVPWRVPSRGLPGSHRSFARGDSMEFVGHVPLSAQNDPRRFDIRASLRDPMQQLLVKVYEHQASVDVWAIIDLSKSMGFEGHVRKLDIASKFIESLSYSVYKTGDRFGSIGVDIQVHQNWVHPPTRRREEGIRLGDSLRNFMPTASGLDALLDTARYIRRRSLVFIVSDFHMPMPLLERSLDALNTHQTIPVVITDPIEDEAFPRFGLVKVQDSETGSQRVLWMRRSVRERHRARYRRWRSEVVGACQSRGCSPLFIGPNFNADQITKHFFA